MLWAVSYSKLCGVNYGVKTAYIKGNLHGKKNENKKIN